MVSVLEPKEISVSDIEGIEHNFEISKFTAILGREIVAKYPLSGMPKLGDYAVNEETMVKLMGFVSAIKEDGSRVRLVNKALIDNHVKDWQVLAKIEVAMLEYNTSFFGLGKISKYLNSMTDQLPELISKTLTLFLDRSSQKVKPRSKS